MILYGCDYNPEQWDETTWYSDMKQMQEANINIVSLAIFSWALLQPSANRYEFDWLDRCIDLLWKNGIKINMATATAAQPAWLSMDYGDVLPVDIHGNRLFHGSRQTYCPNSPSYRHFAKLLTQKMVERYGEHQAVAMWHVNNEYGCHISACYCDRCSEEFRKWLKKYYQEIEMVNEAWGTDFWSQRYYRWEEITAPRHSAAQRNPSLLLDYQRFISDSLLDLYLAETKIIRAGSPGRMVTTNYLPHFKPLNYFKWSAEVDVVAIDNYPDPTPGKHPSDASFDFDLARSLKEGAPFLLMEQATSQVNWRPINTSKRPGWMRLISYQAIGRGADAIMFFQWRQSRKGAEKFHSAIAGHNPNRRTRSYEEVVELGKELGALEALENSSRPAQVGIVFDYECWWALEYTPGPSEKMRYIDIVKEYYRPLFDLNIPVDFVSQSEEILKYRFVIVPQGYLLQPGFADVLRQSLSAGNTLLVGPFSGIVNRNDTLHSEGYLGSLRQLLGIAVEEFDALQPNMRNSIRSINRYGPIPKGSHPCRDWCDVVTLRGARALAVFEHDYYAGSPALTINHSGSGKAFYLSTRLEDSSMKQLLNNICLNLSIQRLPSLPPGVEASLRKNGMLTFLFILNHNPRRVTINLRKTVARDMIANVNHPKGLRRVTLPPFGVLLLEIKN